MTRSAAIALLFALAGPQHAAAQLTFRVHGVSTSHVEFSDALKSQGFGIGGGVEIRRSRLQIDASVYRAWLDPNDETALESFAIFQGDLRASYHVTPSVAIQAGVGRRFIDPEFAAQDVALFRVGLRAGTRLARIADIWGRGAYLVAPQFSGGGSAPFAFEIGLGASFGNPEGALRARIEEEGLAHVSAPEAGDTLELPPTDS